METQIVQRSSASRGSPNQSTEVPCPPTVRRQEPINCTSVWPPEHDVPRVRVHPSSRLNIAVPCSTSNLAITPANTRTSPRVRQSPTSRPDRQQRIRVDRPTTNVLGVRHLEHRGASPNVGLGHLFGRNENISIGSSPLNISKGPSISDASIT